MITVTDEMVEAAQHELKYIRYGLRDAEMRMAIQAALLASDALAVSGWQPIETAPRDGTPILGWCVHAADIYHDDSTGRLTDYACSVEGLGRVEDGPHVLVWGGGGCEYDEWSGISETWPDWWFRLGSYFEQAANPIAWQPITPPVTADTEAQRA